MVFRYMTTHTSYVHYIRKALQAVEEGRVGLVPVTTRTAGTQKWDEHGMRDDWERGKHVREAIYRENRIGVYDDWTKERTGADAIIHRGYEANPPVSFLDLLPTGERGGREPQGLRREASTA